MKPWQKLTDLFKTNEVNTEMVKKYKGTILGIKFPDGTTTFGEYRGVIDDNQHLFLDKSGDLLLSEDTDCDVFIPKIERGLYNTSKGVVSVYRNPYRQYRKGLSNDSYCVLGLKYFLVDSCTNTNLFKYCVKDILENPDYYGDMGLLNSIGEVAVSRDFALTINHTDTKEELCLWYDTYHVGFFTNNRISVINPVFRQEIVDFWRGCEVT